MSLILALAMILTMMPAAVFAGTGAARSTGSDDTIKLLTFGNSTTNGYGLSNCNSSNLGFSLYNNYLADWAVDSEGSKILTEAGITDKAWTMDAAELYNEKNPEAPLGRMSEYAFPWVMKEYLSEDHTKNVNLTPLNFDGMRSDDIRAFIDEDFYHNTIQREAEYTDRWFEEHDGDKGDEDYGYFTAHTGYYIESLYIAGAIDEPSYEKAAAYIQQKIKDADVIVIDVCGNNFGIPLLGRVLAMLGTLPEFLPNTYETIADVDSKYLTDDVKQMIREFRQYLISNISALQSPVAQQLIDSYLFGLADCMVNFNAYMDYIHDVNSDATVINVGLNNPLQGLKIKANGATLDASSVSGIALNIANTYMKALDENADWYYYAELPESIESFESVITDADSLEDLLADDEFGCGKYAIEKNYTEYVKEFLTTDTDAQGNKVADGDARALYSLIQSAIKEDSPNASFPDWDSLSDGDGKGSEIAVNVGVDENPQYGYVVYDPAVAYNPEVDNNKLADAVRIVTTADDTELVQGEVFLTKNEISNIVETKIKPMIMEILYEALKYHQTIDFNLIQDVFGDMAGEAEKLRNITLGLMAGDDEAVLEDPEWTMLVLEEKILFDEYYTIHPDKRGCDTKANAVKKAYDSGVTAREQTRDEVKAELEIISATLKELAAKLIGADTEQEAQEIYAVLQELGDKLYDIGIAALSLPEYGQTVNEFIELQRETAEELKVRMELVDKKMAMVTARYINADFETGVSFSGGKAKITLTLDKDELADGYILKLNGKKVNAKEKNGKLTYTIKNAKVGSKYNFALTPYILYDNNGKAEKISGKTVKKTVAPKVSLKKAKIRKVTVGSKSVTVKWAKVKGADGYKISCKAGGKTTTVTVKGGSKTSAVATGLAGGSCTVKVRAYKTVGGKKYYGKWSKSQKVTVR